ncbi:HupE/UreJ family protein [Alphaproteobacteria bacterium]|nr:HupE/UreJ family protein [Alphaproteobacteria bacterium]
MKNCKALTYRLVLAVCLIVISPLTMSAISMSAIAHEIRPAVADLSMTSAPPSADDQALLGRLSITIDLNAELFLAGLDASLVRDTDDAPQGKDYDALRALTADQLAQKFTDQWPDFEKALDGLADNRPLSFQLDAIEVEDNPAVTLPRSSKIQISAPLEPSDANVRFGWNATLGPLVIRQQSQTEKLENLYTAYLEPGVISAPIKRQGVTVQPVLMTMLDYAKIGFVHIVPKGLDHILFVLGLFFYAARWRPLLGQVTLFTLAHTTTLMLASTGHIVVSPNLVEPLIAASIIYVAFENLRSERLHAGRLLVIFAFGLLHGLGFASVLGDIGLADGQFMVSLISFNIGVELGQLAVLIPAFLLFGVAAGNALWYRRLISIPSSYLIGAIGMWMLITRVFAN